ncbi:putative peptide ABC transporter permease [Actinacidiphila reveromycinica]|uniref:Putative peptide ABC transporter permease n=1 Tax=Actinacidiphila reveromycinica TaxID=659352 RepID=A0A7U3VT02_9ACTN|nr:ABC transporter permease [Streptomyces sp. SN-593]BBB02314.1 putative peptide ABC transporter permease [Streptomyces sp. SN-593]
MRPPGATTALWVLRRLLGAVATLVTLATVVFFLLKLVPGDEARVVAGTGATPAQVAATRARLGLDSPLLVQWLRYLGRIARGDLGTSSSTQGPVAKAVWDVLPGTAELVVASLVISVAVAVPLAALSALRDRGAGDAVRRVLVVVCAGLPVFWLALMLQYLLGSRLGVLPISGSLSAWYDVPRVTGSTVVDSLLAGNPAAAWDAVQHLFLPALVLAVPQIGMTYRVARAELLRVLTREHVLVARAVGVPRRRLIRRHVVPQALTPVVILLGIEFGYLFGGAVLVESVFGRSGLGAFLTNAVAQKDTVSVEGGVLVIGVIVVATSLVVDLIQIVRDPRVRATAIGA